MFQFSFGRCGCLVGAVGGIVGDGGSSTSEGEEGVCSELLLTSDPTK